MYEGKWRVFCTWCSDNDLRPLELTKPQLADFLIWLFSEKNLAPITIKGYRSMIADTLRHHGRDDIGRDKDISDLLANFERNRPRTSTLFPQWDLTITLRLLANRPYEPLETAPIRELTLKTCFLTALATACRVSEIHALARDADHLQIRNDGSIHLLTQAGFIAKNRLPSLGNQEVTIKPLPRDEPDTRSLLDPVRALLCYLRRTRDRPNPQSRLFLPIARHKQHITVQTISSWLKRVIREAYAAEAEVLANQPRAHEVRAIATSLAFTRNVAIKDVIDAVGWRSQSTFGAFYLRDCNTWRQDVDALGAITAAQHVTRPPR